MPYRFRALRALNETLAGAAAPIYHRAIVLLRGNRNECLDSFAVGRILHRGRVGHRHEYLTQAAL